MPVDSRIALAFQPMDMGNALQAYKFGRDMRQEDAAQESQNALKAAMQSAKTPEERINVLASYDPKSAGEYAKSMAQADKAKAETSKTGVDQAAAQQKLNAAHMQAAEALGNGWAADPELTKHKMVADLYKYRQAGVFDDQAFNTQLQHIGTLPDDSESLGKWAKQHQIQMMDAKDAWDRQNVDPNTQAQINAGMVRDENGNLIKAVQMQQDQANKDRQFNFDVADKNRHFNLDSQKGQNGGKMGKPPTEFQSKSAGYYSRMKEANDILNGMVDASGDPTYSPMGVALKNAAKGSISGAAVNSMLSENSQKAEQAQRNFINAVLRRESGATINEDEFDNARKQYFPQPGDSNEVLAQKKANRESVIQAFMNDAGNAPIGGGQPSGGGDDLEAIAKQYGVPVEMVQEYLQGGH